MRVRLVCAGDRVDWLQMRCELWPSADAETHAAEIDRFFAGDLQDPAAVLVAEDSSGEAVGLIELSIRSYAEGCVTGRVGFVEGWYVKPSSQRRGIGRALIEEAEHWALAQGCTELGSDAEIENEPGILAHRHVGFEETGRIVCFRKSLSKA